MFKMVNEVLSKLRYNLSKDFCYTKMEDIGVAAFGSCSGVSGGDKQTDYLNYSCIGCPYLVLGIKKGGIKMTKEEAREKAERKVYCFMTKGSIDAEISNLGIKCKKSRDAKEAALIEHYVQKWSSEEEANTSVKESEKDFSKVIDSFKYVGNSKGTTWDNMKAKYGDDRDNLSVEQEREFVDDCFDLYEAEGFAETFDTPYEDKSNVGRKFIVLGRLDEEYCDLCCLPMWRIAFDDGTVLDAKPEEIIPSEIQKNCR